MKLINDVVFDIEQSETLLDLEKEYNKVSKYDPNFIKIIDAMEERLAEKVIVSRKGKTYISHADASRILIESILSLRHIILRSIQISKLEKGYKKEKPTNQQLHGYKKLWQIITNRKKEDD